MTLNGKRAVVTGAASRGIGRAIVEAFLAAGADCVVIDRRVPEDREWLNLNADELPSVIRADVSDPVQLTAALAKAELTMGGIDVLVNAAAVIQRKPFLELTLEDWDTVHAVDLRPYFVGSQWVAQSLVDRDAPGSIVNIASITANVAVGGQAHYCAAKGGVLSLTRAAAVELAEHRIRVNSISPGTIETDFNRSLLADPDFRTLRTEHIPLGRVGQPRDIAAVATLLASDDGSFITGADIVIDGGQMAW